MKKYTFKQVLLRNPYKSETKSYELYSNEKVARFIEESTSTFCKLCNQIFRNINTLEEHINDSHSKQFCPICLINKKCLVSEQNLYSDAELQIHFKKGEYSEDGQLVLYHPYCEFCKKRFYDADALRAHLRSSSHLKCHICEQNFPKLKHVYFKDFNEIEKHFMKSHYLCQLGDCVDKKLDNVYVSEKLLEDHQRQVHAKGKRSKPAMNLFLFNDFEEELEWDQIGKDFIKEFEASEKSYTLKSEDHDDAIIDIREFYPEQVNCSNSMSLEKIKKKLQEYLFRSDFRTDMINIDLVPLFQPLKMTTLHKWEIEKFVREIYEPRDSEPMIEIFFNQKYDQRFQFDYLSEVRRKMWSYSPISYYYVFPQLIRFSKYSQETKSFMDKYYTDSLRDFKDNKFFIFHVKEKASEIFNILIHQIESRVEELMRDDRIDLPVYQKYLKDLNPAFYQENHSNIFLVQREKVKNMYHMIDKTKTNELLKLNWLLKLGFSNNAYKIMYDHFYYKTVDKCGKAVKMLSIQELALLYAYTTICLEALGDKKSFNANKSNPQTMFFSKILGKIQKRIDPNIFSNLRLMENKCVDIIVKSNPSIIKADFINEEEHPSLLDSSFTKQNVPVQTISLFGQTLVNKSSSNLNHTIRVSKKKTNLEKCEKNEEFPMLLGNDQHSKICSKNEEEQFFENDIEEERVLSKSEILKGESGGEFVKAKLYKERKNIEERKEPGTEWCNLVEESIKYPIKKRKKLEEILEKNTSPALPKSEQKLGEFEEKLYIKKVTKEELRAGEETGNKKKCKKNKKVGEKLIEKEELESQEEEPSEKRKKQSDTDLIESNYSHTMPRGEKFKESEEKIKKGLESEKEKKYFQNKEEFDSLLEAPSCELNKGKSIINMLIKDSQKYESPEPEVKIKKGRKGKAVVIEKFELFNL